MCHCLAWRQDCLARGDNAGLLEDIGGRGCAGTTWHLRLVSNQSHVPELYCKQDCGTCPPIYTAQPASPDPANNLLHAETALCDGALLLASCRACGAPFLSCQLTLRLGGCCRGVCL